MKRCCKFATTSSRNVSDYRKLQIFFQKKESEEIILPVPTKQTTGVWKPRCLMQNIARAGAVPNINDQDLFPTFEAAEKIEKLKKDDEKKRLFCRKNFYITFFIIIKFWTNRVGFLGYLCF